MPSPYVDLPLLQPDKQIRLLRLEPSLPNSDDYHFTLAVHNFHDDVRPCYIAISYTWGDAVPLLPVIVNGKTMRVRFNCWYALFQMRHHGFTDYLWIDSLCINQDNEKEKNFQVAIMGSIYESALWVASCLGTGETIGITQSALTSNDRKARLARIKLGERFDQLPYFDRVWIKQEIILARKITLFYGLEKISWEDFNVLINTMARPLDQHLYSEDSSYSDLFGASNTTEVSDNCYGESQEFNLLLHETEIDSTTVQLCNHRSSSKSGTFVDLVLRYKTAKSTNPKDKIYALLSLLPKEDIVRQNLPIDYGQPTFFLFHTIVRLVYHSTYGNMGAVQKHQVLDLVRKWLSLDENNPDMDNYLRSIPSSPSDWLPSSTSDLASPWLKGYDPEISLDVIEVYKLHEEDELNLNFNLKAEECKPLSFLEKINTWRPNDEKWSKKDIDQLVPIKLKTSKVAFTWPDIQSETSTGMKEFLVNADVGVGDFIAMIIWGGSEDVYHNIDRWTAAYAIFRSLDTRGKNKVIDRVNLSAEHISNEMVEDSSPYSSKQGKEAATSLKLHSWAVPVRKDLTLLTRGEDFFPYNRDLDREQSLGKLKLHHRDALIPLILNETPLHALMYLVPEGSIFSILYLNNAVESGSQEHRTKRSSKRKADYEYIRDVLG